MNLLGFKSDIVTQCLVQGDRTFRITRVLPVFRLCVPSHRQELYGTHFVLFFQVHSVIIPFFRLLLIYKLTYVSAVVEYSLAMPGIKDAIERIYLTINVLRTDERDRFLVENIKSVIVMKTHYKNYSYNEFYNISLKEFK